MVFPSIETPEWVRHAVFYQIFPDRFARSGRVDQPGNIEPWDSDPTPYGYKGGDLLGVRDRLDYLQDLGITALYFNPIFQSASNHRYHTHDYYRVDPLLGGDEAFDALLAECRRRDIRVVLDGVFNHASRGFFQFNDVLENGASSAWLDWWEFSQHPANAYDHSRPPGYRAWIGLHALPAFNTGNPQVREYLMRVGEHWLRKGIDGWRLDVPTEVTTPGFWEEFRQRCRSINPEAYLVGEIWEECPEWLRGDRFDGVMNYRFTEAVIGFSCRHRVVKEAVTGRSYAPWPGIDGRGYAARIDRLLGLYPWTIQLTQLNLLDSHDTSRFRTIAGEDRASVELATLLLFTFPGAPSVYYGDEIGLTGALPDHWARKPFPWDHPETWDHGLLRFHKQIIALRHRHRALRTGAYRSLVADDDLYTFARHGEDETLVVVANSGDRDHTARIPLGDLPLRITPPTVLFVTGEAASVTLVAGSIAIVLPARSSVVLDCSPERDAA